MTGIHAAKVVEAVADVEVIKVRYSRWCCLDRLDTLDILDHLGFSSPSRTSSRISKYSCSRR
jgi:hypothetical protein